MTDTIRAIRVVPYDPEWPNLFEEEAIIIQSALGANGIAIHHIGSTAVVGVWAKPKIDILAVVKNAANSIEALSKIGLQYKGEYNIPLHYGFSKRGPVDINLHVYEEGHPEIELNLLFRDYLRTHPDRREAYTLLKEALLREPSIFEKTNFGFSQYTLRKGDFIRDVLKKAGFNRLRILKCSDETEWAAAKAFRKKYFFDPHAVEDPYSWTSNHPEHAHLLLYQGVEIVRYAHIQFSQNSNTATCTICIDPARNSEALVLEFSSLYQKWLKHLGVKNVVEVVK